jgi:hypothetical protein
LATFPQGALNRIFHRDRGSNPRRSNVLGRGGGVGQAKYSNSAVDKEASMPKKPELTEVRAPGELIYVGWGGGFRCPGPTSDPAVGGYEHTEYFLEQDEPTQKKLMAARLEAEANVLKAVADGYSKMASAVKGDK